MIGVLLGELTYPAHAEQITRRLAAMPETFVALVAEADIDGAPEVLGVAVGRTSWRLTNDRPIAQLITLVTHASRRGSGVGTALVTAVEEWARCRGADRLLVLSGLHRVEAHGWYERRGYRHTGVRLAKDL